MEMVKPKPKPKPKKDVLRLPPGFRFHPTDEELVVHYLSHKVHSSPNLPLAAASIIADADLCKSDPWDLPGDWEQERFFFGTKEIKYPNGNRSNRATRSGYWKATGLDKQIVAAKSKEVVGMKKTLVFYKGKPPAGSRTDWIMHEYRLLQTQEKWVLCRIFLKRRGNKEEEEAVVKPAIFYDFLQAAAAPEPVMNLVSYSSSGSSGIIEADASSASVAAYDQDSSS